jgi:hypothetical protein
MRSTAHRLLALAATTALAVLAASAPAQAADQAFANRYAKTQRGNILSIGNASMTCPAAAANCANARARTGGTEYSNNDFTMEYVDVDGATDLSTFNSSRADISLPAGAEVTFAGLYWAADTTGAGGGAAAPNAALKDTVKVKIDAGAYQTVQAAAADLLTSTAQPSRYRGFADITSLLPVSGTSSVTVANIQAGRGADRFAGWGLMVAYRDGAQPIRRLNVYDGLGTVSDSTGYSTTIGPFLTPHTGPVQADIGMIAFEGDAGLTGEVVKFNGATLSDAKNPAANAMNSTISQAGADFTAKTPDYRNQLGTDVDTLSTSGVLDTDQSSAVLQFSTSGDYYLPSAFSIVAEEGPPYRTAAPSVSGSTVDGSTLTAAPGSWNGTPTITYGYQWQRCDTAVSSCTDVGTGGNTYTLGPDDVGSRIRVSVVATNDAGSSAPATSAATAAVAKLAPSNLTVPQLTGTVRDGETLGTDDGTWKGTAPLALTYTWERCNGDLSTCVTIAGETAAAYTLSPADVGKRVRSRVKAANDAGEDSAPSAATAAVSAILPTNTVLPEVSGTPRTGPR